MCKTHIHIHIYNFFLCIMIWCVCVCVYKMYILHTYPVCVKCILNYIHIQYIKKVYVLNFQIFPIHFLSVDVCVNETHSCWCILFVCVRERAGLTPKAVFLCYVERCSYWYVLFVRERERDDLTPKAVCLLCFSVVWL